MNVEQVFAQGVGAHQSGNLVEAERAYRTVLAVVPMHAGAMHYLGMILAERRELDGAYGLMKRSVELMPAAAFWANFGALCRLMKRNAEAQGAYEAALKLDGRAAATWNNLGNLHGDMGRMEAAIEAYRRALELDPQHPNTRMNLAKSLGDAGRWEESEAEFRRALAEKPNAERHSNLLLNMHCDPGQTAETIFAEHVRWAELYTKPVGRAVEVGAEDSERKLRVGYVSGDFREHPAGHVLLPLVEHHDRAQFSVVLYSTGIEDGLTGRFRAAADGFVDVAKLSETELAERVRADGIDILVDCANHTGGNRLAVFAMRPAAVSFTGFGLPSTTGISAIDYRLTDSFFDPVGDGRGSAEELVRMDPCAWCYDPVGEGLPEVEAGLPLERLGHVTFGSLNNLSKTSAAAVGMWAEILRRVAGSKFMMVAGGLEGQSAFGYERVVGLFQAEGIGEERLILVERAGRVDYFRRYGEMDVGLDTFPFCGGVTTLDALYMGVPVVTRAGATYVSRTGVSVLNNVGLGELVAGDAAGYVEKAVGLAGDVGRLRELRAGLRGRLTGSVLMDGAGYARRVEGIYREKWRLRNKVVSE